VLGKGRVQFNAIVVYYSNAFLLFLRTKEANEHSPVGRFTLLFNFAFTPAERQEWQLRQCRFWRF
jgi:hypothetical protein